jgi:flagellar basal body-associated protein FliL
MATRELQRRLDPATPAASVRQRGTTWLGLVAIFALGAAAGWLGAHFTATATRDAARAGAATRSQEEAVASLKQRMLALDPFIVNLGSEDAARYLKVKVELEAESPALRGELEARLPQVRDGVISVLSARDVADVTSFEGKALLKHDIQDRLNGLLQGGRVRSVLFTEFVVQ